MHIGHDPVVVADARDALVRTVPVETVQNSRKVLPSPISSRVGSPAYFLSCGSVPASRTAGCGCRARWSCDPRSRAGPMVVPAPISTCGPTIPCRGPTTTDSMQPGRRIDHRGGMDLRHERSNQGLQPTRRIVHISSASAAACRRRWRGRCTIDASAPGRPSTRDELVARLDRTLEARNVDAGEVDHHVVGWLLAHRGEGQQRRGLRQRLQDQHAREDRPARKWPKIGSLKVMFLTARMLLCSSMSSTRSTSRIG